MEITNVARLFSLVATLLAPVVGCSTLEIPGSKLKHLEITLVNGSVLCNFALFRSSYIDDMDSLLDFLNSLGFFLLL